MAGHGSDPAPDKANHPARKVERPGPLGQQTWATRTPTNPNGGKSIGGPPRTADQKPGADTTWKPGGW